VDSYRNPLPAKTTPFEGWSVNILPVRSTVVALPRNEMEDHALFAGDVAVATDAEAGF
jgi:hypothetical protein